MKSHPQKNTLLQFAQGNVETKNCKREIFFSNPRKIIKQKIQRSLKLKLCKRNTQQ
jgi:hypothetical protein